MDLNIVRRRDHSAILHDPLSSELHIRLVDPRDRTYSPVLRVESNDRAPKEVLGQHCIDTT